MNRTRRGFLGALVGAIAAPIVGAAVVDPERLGWVPGKKLISIPKQQREFLVGPGFIEALKSWDSRGLFNPELSYEEFHEQYMRPARERLIREMEAKLSYFHLPEAESVSVTEWWVKKDDGHYMYSADPPEFKMFPDPPVYPMHHQPWLWARTVAIQNPDGTKKVVKINQGA